MFRKYIPILLFLNTLFLFAQESTLITGTVLNGLDSTPIEGAEIKIEGNEILSQTDNLGTFQIAVAVEGDFIMTISFQDYLIKRIPITVENDNLDIGTVYLEKDITFEKSDNLITLTDAELLDDEGSSNSLGLLQSTRDVFLNRAAFDFGQAFFRVRGYDSQNGEILLNGVPMNKMFDGRPQWNNWGS